MCVARHTALVWSRACADSGLLACDIPLPCSPFHSSHSPTHFTFLTLTPLPFLFLSPSHSPTLPSHSLHPPTPSPPTHPFSLTPLPLPLPAHSLTLSLSSPSHSLHPPTPSPSHSPSLPLPHPLTLLTLPLPSPTHSPHPLTPLPSHSLTLHTLQHCTGRSRTGVPRHRQVRVSPHGVGRLCNRTLSSNSGTDGDTQLAI